MARVLAAVAVCTLAISSGEAQVRSVNLISLLETYAAGKHDDAIAQAAALKDLGPLRLQFVQQTPGWISNNPDRRAAVAGFVVELAGARLEDDWGRLSDLI